MCKIKRTKIKLVIWIVLISSLVFGGGFLIANHVITNVQTQREIERDIEDRFLYLSELLTPILRGLSERNWNLENLCVSTFLRDSPEYAAQVPVMARQGFRLFIEYHPNIDEVPSIGIREASSFNPCCYLYTFRSQLEGAYFLRADTQVCIEPINVMFIRLIIKFVLVYGFFFTIGAFWAKDDLRNAKKEAEDSDIIR